MLVSDCVVEFRPWLMQIFWKVKSWSSHKRAILPTGATVHVLPLTQVLRDPWWSQMRTKASSSTSLMCWQHPRRPTQCGFDADPPPSPWQDCVEVDDVRGQSRELLVLLSCTVLTFLSGYQGDYCGTATASFDPVGVTVSTCWICFCQTPCGFFVKSIYRRRKLSLVVRQVKRKCSVVSGISEGILWNKECTSDSTASWCFVWNKCSRGNFVNLLHQILIFTRSKCSRKHKRQDDAGTTPVFVHCEDFHVTKTENKCTIFFTITSSICFCVVMIAWLLPSWPPRDAAAGSSVAGRDIHKLSLCQCFGSPFLRSLASFFCYSLYSTSMTE